MTPALEPVRPGAALGIFGGGQLGRMISVAASRMGYATRVLDPVPGCPASQVTRDHLVASYTDLQAARDLAGSTVAIACEFENVDAAALEVAERTTRVFPPARVLRIAQHRIKEKTTLRALGFPVPDFAAVLDQRSLDAAIEAIGLPGVLKTATMGYDGKGQQVIRQAGDARAACARLAPRAEPLIYESFVAFTHEISVIAARGLDGSIRCFPPFENIHRDGILDVTIAPARLPGQVLRAAEQMASGIIERLDSFGLICVEMFVTRDGGLLVNELAPRPHNSGHLTLDTGTTSQFEQLVRTMCNLPLGDTRPTIPAVMVNLLGDIWTRSGGDPDFAAALAVPGTHLHLYGKSEARPGRKMGHITVVANDVATALERALDARTRLEGTGSVKGRMK